MPPASQKTGNKPAPFPDISPASSPQTGLKRKFKAEDDEDSVPVAKRSARTFKAYEEHQKHEKHFYPDGNILLQIGKTRFKVHRSRLVSASSWFRKLMDHYNGATLEGEEVDDDVDQVVDKADDVGDDPLFFLDAAEDDGVPSAEEFAALLTALYDGINYAFTPPTIDEVCAIYGPAWYYDFKRYLDFAEKYLFSFFPDFDSITAEPSLHNAVETISLSYKYDLGEALPRALHDLARAPISALEQCLLPTAAKPADAPPPAAGAGNAPLTSQQKHAGATAAVPGNANAQAAGASNPKPNADAVDGVDADADSDDQDDANNVLKKINARDFARILILQRQLTTAWDPIVKELVDVLCYRDCNFRPPNYYGVFNAVMDVRLRYPCDPLMGIQELGRSANLEKNRCKEMKETMTELLKARKALICKKLKETWTK